MKMAERQLLYELNDEFITRRLLYFDKVVQWKRNNIGVEMEPFEGGLSGSEVYEMKKRVKGRFESIISRQQQLEEEEYEDKSFVEICEELMDVKAANKELVRLIQLKLRHYRENISGRETEIELGEMENARKSLRLLKVQQSQWAKGVAEKSGERREELAAKVSLAKDPQSARLMRENLAMRQKIEQLSSLV